MNQTRHPAVAPGNSAARLLIAMPYYQGSGLAWNYIEQVATDLSEAAGGNGTVAYPTVATGVTGGRFVERMFYGTTIRQTLENAKWLRRSGITHLYFAEHVAFDWRFVMYRLWAGVHITVHYHHAGGRATPYRGLARLVRVMRRSVPLLQADQIICVSEFIRQRVINISHVHGARCTTILNAVLPDGFLSHEARADLRYKVRQEMGIVESDIVVVCGARAALEKGIDILFEAFDRTCATLRARGVPEPLLLYAGDGPDLVLLREKREQLPSKDRIRILGRVRTMHELLAASDLAVLPSVCDEAFGLFAVESMQAGLAVIVTDRGGLPESVTDGVDGFIVPAGNAEALTAKIEELVTNANARALMSERGRERVAVRNSYDKMIGLLAAQVIGRQTP